MHIVETKKEGLKREYKVTIPSSELDAQVEERLTSVGQQVKMAGFRQGKVPVKVLKQRYGSSTLMEVANDLMQKGVDKLLQDYKLTPALRPNISLEKVEEGKDLHFSVTLEVTPVVEPKEYKEIKLEKLKLKASGQEVKEELEKIAASQFVTEPVEKVRPAKKGDVVVINFEGKLASGEVIEGGADQNHPLELGSNSFIPGFEDQLIGITPGETREVKVEFPKAYHEKKLAGKPAIFTVTQVALHEKKPAKVDDALAKKFGFEDLSKLEEQIHKEVNEDYAAQARIYMKRQLLDALAEMHDFEVPSGMVDAEFTAIWQQLQHALAQTKDREEVLGEDKDSSEEELRTDYRKIAERRVRLGLLLAEIGRRLEITVTPEEMRQAVIAEARRYPGQEKQVFEFYSKNNEALLQLRAPVFEEKVVDHIFGLVNVLETEVESKEFKKRIENI